MSNLVNEQVKESILDGPSDEVLFLLDRPIGLGHLLQRGLGRGRFDVILFRTTRWHTSPGLRRNAAMILMSG